MIKRLYITLIAAIIGAAALVAQDNHNYQTPVGRSIYYEEVTDANRKAIQMHRTSPMTEGNDGLMVSFHFRANLSLATSPIKLLTFTEAEEQHSHLEIFYQGGTIMIRRHIAPGSPYYYDYDLYDPMFEVEDGVTSWEVRVFFTGYFLWLETRNTHKLLSNKWHAPVFFGLDLPDLDMMSTYLGQHSDATLIFGDANPCTPMTMPEEISIYEFKYTSLKDELQANFSDDPVEGAVRQALSTGNADDIAVAGMAPITDESNYRIYYDAPSRQLLVDVDFGEATDSRVMVHSDSGVRVGYRTFEDCDRVTTAFEGLMTGVYIVTVNSMEQYVTKKVVVRN